MTVVAISFYPLLASGTSESRIRVTRKCREWFCVESRYRMHYSPFWIAMALLCVVGCDCNWNQPRMTRISFSFSSSECELMQLASFIPSGEHEIFEANIARFIEMYFLNYFKAITIQFQRMRTTANRQYKNFLWIVDEWKLVTEFQTVEFNEDLMRDVSSTKPQNRHDNIKTNRLHWKCVLLYPTIPLQMSYALSIYICDIKPNSIFSGTIRISRQFRCVICANQQNMNKWKFVHCFSSFFLWNLCTFDSVVVQMRFRQHTFRFLPHTLLFGTIIHRVFRIYAMFREPSIHIFQVNNELPNCFGTWHVHKLIAMWFEITTN